VARALDAGGPARLLATVQNLLGAKVAHVVVVGGTQLAELVKPAGPLTVDVPNRVEQTLPNKRIQIVYEAGRAILPPGSVAQFLELKGDGNDLARLARQQAFWDAWLARLHKTPEAVPAGPDQVRSAVATIAKGEWEIKVLPVQAQGSADDGLELYKASDDELARTVAPIFGSPVHGQAPRPRVRILNGTGELELAQKVADKLTPADIQVTLTGNADRFDYDKTQIVYYSVAKRSMAEAVKKAIGIGVLVHNRNETNVVDVTVVVGKDFHSAGGGRQARPRDDRARGRAGAGHH
jgi:hypothetical protein